MWSYIISWYSLGMSFSRNLRAITLKNPGCEKSDVWEFLPPPASFSLVRNGQWTKSSSGVSWHFLEDRGSSEFAEHLRNNLVSGTISYKRNSPDIDQNHVNSLQWLTTFINYFTDIIIYIGSCYSVCFCFSPPARWGLINFIRDVLLLNCKCWIAVGPPELAK